MKGGGGEMWAFKPNTIWLRSFVFYLLPRAEDRLLSLPITVSSSVKIIASRRLLGGESKE